MFIDAGMGNNLQQVIGSKIASIYYEDSVNSKYLDILKAQAFNQFLTVLFEEQALALLGSANTTFTIYAR